MSDYRDEINELWRRAATKAVSAGSLYICAEGKSDHNTALAKSAAAFADELVIEYQKRRIRHYAMAPDPVAPDGDLYESPVAGKHADQSMESLALIEAHECLGPPNLVSLRFRRCFNEIHRLTELLRVRR